MDPLSVMKVLWKHRWLALPAVILVLLISGYMFFFGPRTYVSSAIYVIATPDTPTDRELERHSRLAKLNADNPYLRAADHALIAHVLVAKMSAQSTSLGLEAAGLSTEFSVTESPASNMAFIVSAFADTPEEAVATRQWLVDNVGRQLYDLQKVNGADDRYLFTALPVDVAQEPVEKVSSRLRSTIVVLGAGLILVMGVVSLAAGLDARRRAAQMVDAGGLRQASAPTQREQASANNGAEGLRADPLQPRAQVLADYSAVPANLIDFQRGGTVRPTQRVDAGRSTQPSASAHWEQPPAKNGGLRAEAE